MNKRSVCFLLMIIMPAGFIACSRGYEKMNKPGEKPVAVKLSTVSEVTQPEILASGVVEASQKATISTRAMGRITNIYVQNGDKVNKGQLLASIWDEDIRAKRGQTDALVAEAEGAYATAQKDYDRFSNLYRQQSATAKELDDVALLYHSAKARVKAAKQMRAEVNANLSYSSLTAPFAGVVTQKLAEAGSMANPGMPLLTIEQDETFQIAVSVAESDISRVHLGDVAHIQIKSTGKLFDAKINQINPSSQFTGGQYIVKISIPPVHRTGIYSGMFAGVRIPVKETPLVEADAVLVPLSAIIERDGLTGIYTMSADSTALLRWIRLGKRYGDMVEVISGLAKKEKFIRAFTSRLYNGVPVTVRDHHEGSAITYKR